MTDPVKRGRRQFLLVALVFAAPLVAAYLLYFQFPQWRPEGHTNHGELISPARPLPEWRFVDAIGQARDSTALKRKWTYVYLGAGECASACLAKLHQLRQIRTLLNEKRQRVQRVYIAPDAAALAAARAAIGDEHPDLVFLASPDFAALRAFFGDGGNGVDGRNGGDNGDGDHGREGTLYLVDPLGNWLMRYAPEAESKGIHQDIKRLLRVSQIG